jgi:hypothetical protein
MTGSKRVVHWTSETWCESSEIAGSPHTEIKSISGETTLSGIVETAENEYQKKMHICTD